MGLVNRWRWEEGLGVGGKWEVQAKEKLPDRLMGKHIWKECLEDINAIERYLTRNGVVICKFFLHVSNAEQKRRFFERLDDPAKHWKFSPNDVAERQHWNDYMGAYEEMVRATSTKQAPWHVVPADNKWFTRLVVASAIVDILESLQLAYPEVGPDMQKQLKAPPPAFANQ